MSPTAYRPSRPLRIASLVAPCLGLVLAAGPGCSSSSRAGPPGARTTGSGPGSSQRAGADEHPIIIATDRGIEEIDRTGAIVRRLSLTPARRPRFTGQGALIFVAAGLAELRRVGLDGKGEMPVGLIGPQVADQCDARFPGAWDPARLLFADADMVLDKGGQVVCMHLSDGAEEASQASVWLRVDVAARGFGSGGVELVCGSDPPDPDFWCGPLASAAAAMDLATLPDGRHGVRGRELVVARGDALETVRELPVALTEEATSSSGRHALVSAAVKRRGYRVRRILVLDRDSGEFFAVKPGAWPAPMARADWRDLRAGKDMSARAAQTSDVRALATGDVFVVDSLLIAPGERIVDTGGQFAR